jgi:hypothetical protein
MPEEAQKITPQVVARAYLAVFGKEGARTNQQLLVMADLESFCRAYRLSVEQLPSGDMSENNCLVNEGRRSVWLRVRGLVLSAQAPTPEPLKVSRQRRVNP